MKKKDFDLTVVGAGPSGIFCAIFASERGLRVALTDRNSRIGGKIPVTGNSRCNLTNVNISSDNYTGENPLFVRNVFGHYSSEDLIDFFRDMNLRIVSEGEKYYPATKKSETVVEALEKRIKTKNITLFTNTNVTECAKSEGLFISKSNSGEIASESLALCTGGKSYAKIFGSGGGYSLAESLSHTVTRLCPGLTSFDSEEFFFKELSGVSCEAEISLHCGNKRIYQGSGSLLFTHRGFSGPLVMNASNKISKCTGGGGSLTICFLPGKIKEYDSFASYILSKNSKLLKNSLSGIIPASLTESAMKFLKINENMKAGEATPGTIAKLHKILSNSIIKVKANPDFNEAQVTVGGVRTTEINPKSMESKLVRNLYFAGEIIDIAGECGGYNLQFAFSSGYLAGTFV